MTEKILFVDDDQSLLDGIQRRLGRQFSIDTAARPDLGLSMLTSRGPYAVIVADLQMPDMDGVSFLVEVRRRSPESIRMMLTGNASLETAIRAVNDGNIFRFMTKPCPAEQLRSFLEAGLRQFSLEAAEKRAAILDEANRTKDQVLTTVSHELRTPLTILRLTAEILLRARDKKGPPDETLTTIVEQTRKLSRMVDQVLELVQLNADLVTFEQGPVELCELLRDVERSSRSGNGPLVLDIEPAGEPALCTGDADHLRRAFMQLVANARQFSPPGADVRIGLRKVPTGLEVTVRDQGPGVPARLREQVFEPFVQRDEVLVDKPPGLGLGLAIVRRILELHQATVSCHDAPGGGTIFAVTLPARADALVPPHGA